jgi:CRP-like cAMP-binding protein
MPTTLEFKAKVVIYLKGDKTTQFYVLKRGKIMLSSDIDKEPDVEEIGPGNFFGTQAVLGGHLQEETAIAITACELIAFSHKEFEELAFKNGSIVLKMLKSFSGQLSSIHIKVSKLINEQKDSSVDRELNFYNVGHYFLKNCTYRQAASAFEHYLESYPTGKRTKEAEQQLAYAISKIGSSDDLSNQTFQPQNTDNIASNSQMQMQMQYDETMIIFNQKKYPQAFVRFTKLIHMTGDPLYNVLAGNCFYYLGETLMHLQKYTDASTHFINFIQKYPDHEGVNKALFFAATAYEKIGNTQDSQLYFSKLLETLPANSPIRERIIKKMEVFKQ